MEDGHGLVTTDGSWEARAWTGFSDEIFSSENTAVGSEEERRPAQALRRANLPGTPSGTRSPPPPVQAASCSSPWTQGTCGSVCARGRTAGHSPRSPSARQMPTCAL